jgi:hypothetical protein
VTVRALAIALAAVALLAGSLASATERADERAWERFIDGWTRELVVYEQFSTALILRGTYLDGQVRARIADERRRRLGLTQAEHAEFLRVMQEDDAIYHEVVFSADSSLPNGRVFGTEDGWHVRLTADGAPEALVTVFREIKPNPLQRALYVHLNRWSALRAQWRGRRLLSSFSAWCW